MSLTTKVKVAKFSFLNQKSYNRTVIDFNFGRHKDLSTLKSVIHFFGWINPYVYLIEVNNCIISLSKFGMGVKIYITYSGFDTKTNFSVNER